MSMERCALMICKPQIDDYDDGDGEDDDDHCGDGGDDV